MKNKYLKYAILIFIFSQSFLLNAFNIPHLSGRVNDYANIIGDKSYQIEQKLVALEKQTTDQIVVLTVPSIEDASSIEDYSFTVAEKWGIGQKGKDNGLLIVVALTERKMRIEVGYGLEEVITDAMSRIIIERKMKPKFQQNDYASGIEDAVNDICSLLCKDELVVKEYKKQLSDSENKDATIVLLIIGFIILLFGNIPCSIISAIYVIIAINGFFHNLLLLLLFIIICIGIEVLRFAFYDYLEDLPFLGPLFHICNAVTDFILSTVFSGGGSSGSSGGSSFRGGSSGGGFSGGGGHFGGGGSSGSW